MPAHTMLVVQPSSSQAQTHHWTKLMHIVKTTRASHLNTATTHCCHESVRVSVPFTASSLLGRDTLGGRARGLGFSMRALCRTRSLEGSGSLLAALVLLALGLGFPARALCSSSASSGPLLDGGACSDGLLVNCPDEVLGCWLAEAPSTWSRELGRSW